VHNDGGVAMAKKRAAQPTGPDARVTVLNVKGSVQERDYLHQLSRSTGVSAAEIARRGIALWAKKRGYATPADWVIE
jgi:hypothetical protein